MSSSIRTIGAVATASHFRVAESYPESARSRYATTFKQLDEFVEQYMLAMNSPGMTFAMADREGVQRISTYGFSDDERKIGVRPQDLFEIGSISKSFIAICLLQLHQEGKLDLHKPIVEYLPWLRIESAFAPITTHHMLTHSSGLPEDAPLFLADPSARHRAAYGPGEHFHYSNLAYAVLGHLLWTLDGNLLPEAIRDRVFNPLGMTQSEPVISLEIRGKLSKNYSAFRNDVPNSRHEPLSEAPGIVMTDGNGCIASTPRDMGLYIQMLANHGRGPKSRLLSEESFALLSHPHIKAPLYGPTTSYGYGVVLDSLDGHHILRHTGGMLSFASALQVDLDEGVGVFASINAIQGYRPLPVTQRAIELMRGLNGNNSPSLKPRLSLPSTVENAVEYAGTYSSENGRTLEIVADAQKLFLVYQGSRVPVELASDGTFAQDDVFIVRHPDLNRFVLVFGRSNAKEPKSEVVEAGWGSEWFTNSKYVGPKNLEYPKEWEGFVGHYRNENAWIGSTRIALRKGRLFVDGVDPLEAGNGDTFYYQDKQNNPEWVQFCDIVNGRAMRLKFSGQDLWRVMTA
jgi:D-alanyl-D-alanine carboxypeptidase